MKVFLIIFLSFSLSACVTASKQIEKKRDINQALLMAKQAGYVESNPKFSANDECQVLWVNVYDNSQGTDDERYEKGRQAYDDCKISKGF